MIKTPMLMMLIVIFLCRLPRKKSRKCHHCDKRERKSKGNCRCGERKPGILAMHSLERSKHELRVQEGLAVGYKAHV